jgi:hypothetical protein
MTEKKKILLISNGFYPEISPRSFRATELAKEFVKLGHDVTVYSKFRDTDYVDFLNEHPLKFKMWGKSHFTTVPDSKNIIGSLFSRIVNRTLLMLFEYPTIEDFFHVRKILKTEQGYDIMISFSVPYPVHWGTAFTRTKKHPIAKIWVADCGDPYMGDVLDSFRKPFYFKYIEKWFMRKADYITIPIENARKAYYSEFSSKIKVIPQGFSFEKSIGDSLFKGNEIVTFGYAGSLAPTIRDPRPFLDYLKKSTLDFKFVVFTKQVDLFADYVDFFGEKLILLNYIPRNELMTELAKMDFLVNFDNNTEIQSPSKLIDYFLTDRPVLNIKLNFNKDWVDSFLKKDYTNKMKFSDLSQYNIKEVAENFLNIDRSK